MLQYKLLEVLDENTLITIKTIFGDKNIFSFTDKIIGISYDFESNTYTHVLKNIIGLNVRQWILTSSRFINIINYSINNNLNLNSIDFLDFVDEKQIENVKLNITRINMSKNQDDKIRIKQRLVNDLNWIMLDQCIDIKSVSLSYTVPYPPFIVELRFFNNGVLYISDENILKQTTELFKDCFRWG